MKTSLTLKKALGIFFLYLMTSVFFSCSKDQTLTLDETSESNTEMSALILEQSIQEENPSSGAHVVNNGGVFASSFANGITFGSSFTYPTNKYIFENNSPFAPTFTTINATSGLLLSYQQFGNKITLIYGTAVNGLTFKMSAAEYFNAIRENGTAPDVSDYVTRVGGNSTGLIVIAGQFLISHSSPTGVALYDAEANIPVQNGAPTLISDFFMKGGNYYYVSIYENSGNLYELKASLPNDHPKSVLTYSASYSNLDAQNILVTGSFKTKDGTVYQLNETLAR